MGSAESTITALLNVDFGGNGSPYKTGLAAVGLTTGDFWNADYHPNNCAASVPNLKWSNQSDSFAGMTVLNASGSWGNSLPDPMFHTYMYATDGGNTTITLTNLPSGICNVYLYGHTTTLDDNAVFELWSDDVNWGTKGTSIIGPGPTYATWEVGQQYVVFKDVTVTAGKPVVIHASHTKYGYNNLCGMQIAYTGAADTDADSLPDGWEQRCFNNLDQLAAADPDADGLSNLREYQLGTDPTRTDSNANGIGDLNDFERVWIEDATPQGGYQYSAGGDTWNWVSSWYDGSGWGGQVLYPHSGRSWDPRMHVSAKVLNALHEHYFNRSLAVIRPAVGDVLYAYVNLDSSFPPSEVMLQFYTVENNGIGSWDHRAYWGANTINLGVNGTASRYPMGALPTAGQWVRLEVPANVVGLEGKIIAGLRFTLYGGRAAWDSAGTTADRDSDGLPDWWEMLHFGNLLQTATGDPDGDVLNNLEEFNNGSNPIVQNPPTLTVNAYKNYAEDKFEVEISNQTGQNLTGGSFTFYVYFDGQQRSLLAALQPWGPADSLASGGSRVLSFCTPDHSILNLDCAVVYQKPGLTAASAKFRITNRDGRVLVIENTTQMTEGGNPVPRPIPNLPRPNPPAAPSEDPLRMDNHYRTSNPPEYITLNSNPKRGFKNVYAVKTWHGVWGFNSPMRGEWPASFNGNGECQQPQTYQVDTNKYRIVSATASYDLTGFYGNPSHPIDEHHVTLSRSATVDRLTGKLTSSGSDSPEEDAIGIERAMPFLDIRSVLTKNEAATLWDEASRYFAQHATGGTAFAFIDNLDPGISTRTFWRIELGELLNNPYVEVAFSKVK